MFYYNRFDELIDARNKWLKPNGLMFPDQYNYYIAAVNNKMVCDRSNYWQHVFSFDMRPMAEAVKFEPYLQRINCNQVNNFKLHDLLWIADFENSGMFFF